MAISVTLGGEGVRRGGGGRSENRLGAGTQQGGASAQSPLVQPGTAQQQSMQQQPQGSDTGTGSFSGAGAYSAVFNGQTWFPDHKWLISWFCTALEIWKLMDFDLLFFQNRKNHP